MICRGTPRGSELRERSRGVFRLRRRALHAQHLEALARLGFVRARSVQARRRRRGDAARRGDHRGVAVRDEHREFLRGAYERLRRAVRQLNEVLERRRERADALLLRCADDEFQNLAHVFVSKRLLRDLHQQQTHPVVRRVLPADAFQDVLRDAGGLRGGGFRFQERRDAAEHVAVLHRVQLLREPRRFRGFREVPGERGERARKVLVRHAAVAAGRVLRRGSVRLSQLEVPAHVLLHGLLRAEHKRERLGSAFVHLAQRLQPKQRPALRGDARREQVHKDGFHGVVANIGMRTPAQQRGWDPVEPLGFLHGGLDVREARDVRAVHGPEPLQRELANVRLLVQHALANRHEQLRVDRAGARLRDVAHRSHRGDAHLLLEIDKAVLKVPRDLGGDRRVAGGAGGEELRAPLAHLDADLGQLVPESAQKLREVVRVVLRHRAPRRGEHAPEEPHRLGAGLSVIVLQLLHHGGPHRDERGRVHDSERLEDVRAPLAERVLRVPLAAQAVDEEVLHRELQVVLGLAHQRARQVVRRGVLALARLHETLQDRAQHVRRNLLRLFQHRAQHLRRVLLHERAVRGVDAGEQYLEKLGHQQLRARALQVEHRDAEPDGGDVLKQRVRGLKRRRGRVVQSRQRPKERVIHGLEGIVVLERLLGSEDAKHVAQAQRGVQADILRKAERRR